MDRIAYLSSEKVKIKTGKILTKTIQEKVVDPETGKISFTEKKIKVPEEKELRDKYNRPVYKWHSPLVGALTWFTIGTQRVGFYEYAVNDTDLTPSIVAQQLEGTVGLTATAGLLKELGNLIGDALHGNPEIRGSQKVREEIVVSKR